MPTEEEQRYINGRCSNWEWLIHCASKLKGRFIIVTRDSDYGCAFGGKYFLNDQLKQEFHERVGRKSITLTQKLSDALELLEVPVTKKEKESERVSFGSFSRYKLLREFRNRYAHFSDVSSGSTINFDTTINRIFESQSESALEKERFANYLTAISDQVRDIDDD